MDDNTTQNLTGSEFLTKSSSLAEINLKEESKQEKSFWDFFCGKDGNGNNKPP